MFAFRTRSSRPAVSVPSCSDGSGGGLLYGEPLAAAAKKTDIGKSMSTDMTGRLRPLPDWRTGPVPSLEMGCLNSYGMAGPVPPQPAAGPWNTPSPPTATAAAFSAHVPPPLAGVGNSHPPLERQLTINPTFDPRINKPRKSQQQLLYSAAMEYMHRNPPPPLGMPPQQQQQAGPLSAHHHHNRQLPDHHQNVTRIASAPDSIRLWGAAVSGGATASSSSSLPVAIVEPLGMDLLAGVSAAAGNNSRSPIQRRHNSTSDSQLNRNSPTASDPFSSDTWKYDSSAGISPILSASPVGGNSVSGSNATGNIWGPPPPSTSAGTNSASLTPPRRESPPPSPLGPVGSSRPSRLHQDSRQQLKYHLCALFPVDQVL